MKDFHAEIVNLSLNDDTLIKEYPILNVKKRFLGLVKIYTIRIPFNEINKTMNRFQKSLSQKLNKEWYITFHTSERVIVTFREKIFDLSTEGILPVYQKCLNPIGAKEEDKWKDMIQYAKSLGIPDDQCDFLPVDFSSEVY